MKAEGWGMFLGEERRQESGGMAFRGLGDLLRNSGCDEFSSCRSCFRTEVENPVGILQDIHVVFND